MRGSEISDTSFLKPIDSAKFVEELNIGAKVEERQKREAEAERHDLDAAFVTEVSGRVDAMKQTASTDTHKRMNMLADLVYQHSACVDFAPLQNDIEKDLNEMSVSVTTSTGDIGHLREVWDEQKDHFTDFRERRGLKRPAVKPSGLLNKTWELYLFMIGEAVLNMVFFAGGNAMGFTGGLIIALLIAAVNIGASFFIAGYFLSKWTHSIFIVKKLIGWIGSLAFLPLLVASHFVVAHYRAEQMLAAERGEFLAESEYFTAAVAALTENFFALPDIQSYILLLIGIGAGGYAWWKGFHLGDRYPGYTAEYANVEKRRAEFENAYRELFNELEDIRDDVVGRLKAFIDNIGPSVTAMNANVVNARNILGHYQTFLESCETARHSALSAYRNRLPESERSGLEEKVENAPDLSGLNTLIDQLNGELKAAQNNAEDVKLQATEYRRKVINKIEDIEKTIAQKLGVDDGEA